MGLIDFLLLNDFFQRVDQDGTAWSICLRCFKTVSSDSAKTDFEVAKAAHRCHEGNAAKQFDGLPQG